MAATWLACENINGQLCPLIGFAAVSFEDFPPEADIFPAAEYAIARERPWILGLERIIDAVGAEYSRWEIIDMRSVGKGRFGANEQAVAGLEGTTEIMFLIDEEHAYRKISLFVANEGGHWKALGWHGGITHSSAGTPGDGADTWYDLCPDRTHTCQNFIYGIPSWQR